MSSTTATINGNKVTIKSDGQIFRVIRITANSSRVQHVKLTADGKSQEFSGSGEHELIGNLVLDSPVTSAELELTYDDDKPSKLSKGGPYAIGGHNILTIVGENGDDQDYDDTVIQFSGSKSLTG
ncbi:hypothetical protein PT974_07922 [Cladobotryum mycophilum]|uniref:Calcium-mediated lectin domain-containing protein n=1 Tax=Cladobotryum mycophilum TaxID=491253 RepID=A0ABR0SBW8_9HYPO